MLLQCCLLLQTGIFADAREDWGEVANSGEAVQMVIVELRSSTSSTTVSLVPCASGPHTVAELLQNRAQFEDFLINSTGSTVNGVSTTHADFSVPIMFVIPKDEYDHTVREAEQLVRKLGFTHVGIQTLLTTEPLRPEPIRQDPPSNRTVRFATEFVEAMCGPIVIDVRATADYNKRHLPCARSLPFYYSVEEGDNSTKPRTTHTNQDWLKMATLILGGQSGWARSTAQPILILDQCKGVGTPPPTLRTVADMAHNLAGLNWHVQVICANASVAESPAAFSRRTTCKYHPPPFPWNAFIPGFVEPSEGSALANVRCTDTPLANCEEFGDAGFCVTDAEWMLAVCPGTCKFCATPSTATITTTTATTATAVGPTLYMKPCKDTHQYEGWMCDGRCYGGAQLYATCPKVEEFVTEFLKRDDCKCNTTTPTPTPTDPMAIATVTALASTHDHDFFPNGSDSRGSFTQRPLSPQSSTQAPHVYTRSEMPTDATHGHVQPMTPWHPGPTMSPSPPNDAAVQVTTTTTTTTTSASTTKSSTSTTTTTTSTLEIPKRSVELPILITLSLVAMASGVGITLLFSRVCPNLCSKNWNNPRNNRRNVRNVRPRAGYLQMQVVGNDVPADSDSEFGDADDLALLDAQSL